MKAVLVETPGGIDKLVIKEYPMPTPREDELLVKIKATALNRADILQRQGKYPPPPGASEVLGLEMAGIVEWVGSQCSGWKIGDRVCGLLPGGGYAEYCTIPAKMAIPIPSNLSFEEAAAIPEVFLTAFQTMHLLGDVKKGDFVLIHAGASGVGTAAIQLARFYDAIPIVTAGSARKLDFCLQLGAKVAINYKDGEFASHVLEATDRKGVQFILDCVGASFWEQNIACLAMDGKMVMIANMGGSVVENFSLRKILLKRLQIMGSTLRSRNLEYKIQLTQSFVKNILPAFEDGKLKPVIDEVFDWRDVGKAHQRMEENLNMGKIILTITEF
ncbi:MAG: NAD(P)H-quinone oxidoreductase [Calditrichaeota bacterium]|nr:MAG: NAD(P)H-quinone oxidoreductase [Calditrichota bacterium]